MDAISDKIHSLGTPTVEISGDDHIKVVTIKTMHGQKFEIVVRKDFLEITNVVGLNEGIAVVPRSNSSVIIKEQ